MTSSSRSPSSSVAADLADAIQGAAVHAGATAPSVRGADWRQAVVGTVYADGRIETSDGIIARRLETYQAPAAGDLIIITQGSSGAWLAVGRTAPAGSGDWLTPSLASPWINYDESTAYQRARYRRMPDGDVAIEGLVETNGVSVGTSTIFTLPVGYRPPLTVLFATINQGTTVRQLEVTGAGALRLAVAPTGAVTYMSIHCRFSTL